MNSFQFDSNKIRDVCKLCFGKSKVVKERRDSFIEKTTANNASGKKKRQNLLVLAGKPPKSARVGPQYQCETPKWIENSTNVESWKGGTCKMTWSSRRLSEDKVNSFLKNVDSERQEQALQCLHESNYNVSKALKLVSKKRKRSSDGWKEWSVEDKRIFNKTLALLDDKHFNVIRKHMPHKSMGDLVQYYYGEWKFTKARQVWREKCKKRKDYHDDVCYECEVGGDLICCDTCHLVFHLGCAQPKIINLEDGAPWSCKFCLHELRTQNQRIRTAKCVEHISDKLQKAKSWTSKKLLDMASELG